MIETIFTFFSVLFTIAGFAVLIFMAAATLMLMEEI